MSDIMQAFFFGWIGFVLGVLFGGLLTAASEADDIQDEIIRRMEEDR